MSIVYGPVPSWRLGRSLGVDPVSTKGKTCSFDCIYCQLGPTRHPLTERRVFVEPEALASELEKVKRKGIEFDYITFSGVGEPTLAANLAELVEVVRRVFPHHPVAILTNVSLLPLPEVRQDLAGFDLIAAKLDAPDEGLFKAINRPFTPFTLAEIIEGIKRLRAEFTGTLALQMMFLPQNKGRAAEMARIAGDIGPDIIQLNTPLRPSPVTPLTPEEMAQVEEAFRRLPYISVYRAPRPSVQPLDTAETRRRRPE